jgi:hypothetical protein
MSSGFSSIKALKKRKAQKQNKENIFLRRTRSCEFKLQNSVKLRRVNSEPDLNKIQPTIKKPLKFEAAKSERNINILYTHDNNNSIPSSNTMDFSCYSTIIDSDNVKVPIVGFEIVAERSRFTIYKLRVENYENNNFWLVLRRFTDFTRLQTKLKALFPHINLVLPKKKWFGNNFSSAFLDMRVNGLQTFINTILSNAEMRKCPAVREFFCLDEPPMFAEEVSEDCRIVVESQNETIAHLQMQLRAKDEVIANLTHSLQIQKQHNDYLTSTLLAK